MVQPDADGNGRGLIAGDDAARRAVVNNRTRLLSGVAHVAFKLRAEVVERSFALSLAAVATPDAGLVVILTVVASDQTAAVAVSIGLNHIS